MKNTVNHLEKKMEEDLSFSEQSFFLVWIESSIDTPSHMDNAFKNSPWSPL
jgi:hypothetical protein